MDLKNIDLKNINVSDIAAKLKTVDKKTLIKFGAGFFAIIIFGGVLSLLVFIVISLYFMYDNSRMLLASRPQSKQIKE